MNVDDGYIRETRASYRDAMTTRIAARRVFVDGAFAPATVVIEEGVIAALEPFDASADTVLPADAVLLPGLVDSHVHLDEPGRTEWEGFATGTAAAAAGGVTTVVDMPLNSLPVTTSVEALDAKRRAAVGKLAVDVAYWGGAVPENLGSLRELADAGVVGFKCFLSPSGIDEFGHLDAEQLERCLAELAAFDGLLIVHAEDPAHLHADGALGPRYRDFEASRPPLSERAAIERVIDAARRTGARAHIVHVSDGGALDAVRTAKAEGVRLTVETCPTTSRSTPRPCPMAPGRSSAARRSAGETTATCCGPGSSTARSMRSSATTRPPPSS